LGTKSLQEISNDSGVTIVNFATIVQFSHFVTFINLLGDLMERHTTLLISRRWQSSVLDVQLLRGADCDTDHCLVVAKARERLPVSKQTMHKFHTGRFSLRKLNEVEGKEEYRAEISNKFTASENLHGNVNVKRAWEIIIENIKISAKGSTKDVRNY
jgi:hypothetical protein